MAYGIETGAHELSPQKDIAEKITKELIPNRERENQNVRKNATGN